MTATVERIETVVDVLTWVTDTSEASVDEAIDRALSTAAEKHASVPVDVAGDTDATVLADELLYLAVYEVVDNALRHGESPVTVTVDERDDSVVLSITDAGDTVVVSPRESLFEPNTRGTEAVAVALGLYLADLILERYDGRYGWLARTRQPSKSKCPPAERSR